MPTLAIVGRPNVGKSTLFNRLVGKRLALVHDRPGVTRDRRDGEARLGDLVFRIIDTAGFEDVTDESLEARMRLQTEAAITIADLVLFVVDARAGLLPLDQTVAETLRRAAKAVVVLVNKSEGKETEAALWEAFSLGLGEPIAISSAHGIGLDELYSRLKDLEGEGVLAGASDDTRAEEAAADEEGDDRHRPLRIAVVGRPNVGKSTLINAILGEERMLTGPEAGITRDAIGIETSWDGRPIKIFDTAGMRRKARVTEELERLSVADTIRAIRFAEVVVLAVDATQAFEKQDLTLADLVVREGRALVVAFNKWDLVEDKPKALAEAREDVERLIPQVRGVPLVTLSGLYGTGLERLKGAVEDMSAVWNRRIATNPLNEWLRVATEQHPPPAVLGKRIRLRFITQVKARPPTFVIFSSRAEKLPESYLRYLTNGIREIFDMPGVPIRIYLRKPDNPYAK